MIPEIIERRTKEPTALASSTQCLPKTHNVPPEVDFESSRSPAKSES